VIYAYSGITLNEFSLGRSFTNAEVQVKLCTDTQILLIFIQKIKKQNKKPMLALSSYFLYR